MIRRAHFVWQATIILQSLLIVVAALLPYENVYAQQLPSRSITISSSIASATVVQTLQFSFASTSTVGSVEFEYCDNSPLLSVPCNPPAGLSLSSASLTSQTGNTGFSIDGTHSTATALVLTRPAANAAAVPSTYTLTNVRNPSATNQTFFVRLQTFASTDASGPATDTGAVAFATLGNFSVGAFVPPFLKLCVAVLVAPDCSSTSGTSIDLGDLSSRSPKTAVSQFVAATNDTFGYSVFFLGTTMTSGINAIPALASPAASQPGQSQFGINLRRNSDPDIGSDPTGNGSAQPTADYNTPNRFTLVPGATLASSPTPSDYNVMTVSYVVNVATSQPAGVYTTTASYLGIATF